MPTAPPTPPVPPPKGPWQWNNCHVQGCKTNVIIAITCGILVAAIFVVRGVRRLQRNNIRLLTITSALLLLGAGCNGLYHMYVSTTGGEVGVSLAREPLVHDLIYYALLPPIIFEAGCATETRNARLLRYHSPSPHAFTFLTRQYGRLARA